MVDALADSPTFVPSCESVGPIFGNG